MGKQLDRGFRFLDHLMIDLECCPCAVLHNVWDAIPDTEEEPDETQRTIYDLGWDY